MDHGSQTSWESAVAATGPRLIINLLPLIPTKLALPIAIGRDELGHLRSLGEAGVGWREDPSEGRDERPYRYCALA